MKLFELFATLGIDTAQFDAGLNQAITNTKGIREALSQLSQEAAQTGQAGGKAAGFFKSQWQDVKDSLKGIFTVSAGQLVAQGATAAFGWLKQAASDSVELASDLNEVQNVIGKTFGSDAKNIESWAKRAKTNIGMSELAAKQYAGTLGAMLKSSGLTGEKVTEFSKQMVDLAGDMASFYNLDHDTAFEKIRSGISGETEPLKQLGVNMSVANLEAFRLQQGIGTAYDKMSQSEQVELRMKYLAQAMKDASGDFAATADSYANSKKTLEANIQALESNIGQAILPAVQGAVNMVNSLFEGDNSVSARLKAIDKELSSSQVENSLKVSGVEALIDSLEEQEAAVYSRIAQGQQTADAMAGSLDNVAQKSDAVNSAQTAWSKTVEALKASLPEASGLIDAQTGAINGGTEALQAYIDAANVDDEKLTTIQALVDTLKQLEADGFDPLKAQANGDSVTGAMADMALEAARTEEEQAQWMATLQKIVEIMPEAADMINLQTGEIEGGTKALRENTKAWEENLKIQGIKNAKNSYQALYDEAVESKASAEGDIAFWEAYRSESEKELSAIFENGIIGRKSPFAAGWDYNNAADWIKALSNEMQNNGGKTFFGTLRQETEWLLSGLTDDQATRAMVLASEYNKANKEISEAEKTIEDVDANMPKIINAYTLAQAAYNSVIDSMNGAADSLGENGEKITYTQAQYTAALEQEMTTAENLRDKIKELADAHEELRQATEQSVNSLLGGWKKVDAINGMTGEGEDAVAFDLNDYVETLKAQKTFADQYRNMLEDLRGNENVSQDLLSYLAANVTEENAEILNAIHTNPVGDQARAISQAYDERNAANLKLVNESTSLQSEFSKTIQGLEEEVKTMVEALNQQEEARASMRDTVKGGVEGLEDSLPDLQGVMDEIRSAVETGLNWSNIQVRLPNIAGAASSLADAVSGLKNLGGRLGNLNFAPVQLEERAVGLDYVPYDGYVAALHEGERVMTKLENRQFSAGELGSATADLSGLPGLIVAAVRDGMANVSVQIDGQEAGRILIEPVSRGIAERARNRRYAG